MIRSAIDIRPYFAKTNSTLHEYPHNAVILIPILETTVGDLRQSSVKELALRIYRQGKETRNLAFIQIFLQWLAKMGGRVIPSRTRGRDSWDCSVQTIGRSYQCDFGSGEPLGIWHCPEPFMYDGLLEIYPLQGGMVIDTVMRRSRWLAIDEELRQLKSTLGGNVITSATYSPIYAKL